MADELKNVIAQNLECPVCLNTFKDPKILSCSHTFCKACLDNHLDCHGIDQSLRCPVCRAETQVPNQDVSKLQANLALKSLIEEVENHYQVCTNCKSEDKPEAVVYCQDCGRYLCTTCQTKHSQWEGFSGHEVLAMSEITSGKESVRRHGKCRKHPKEDEEWICCDCRRFACFRCVVMEHNDEGHRVIEAAVYESNKSVEDLKSKVEKKCYCFQKYVDFIDQQKDHVSNAKEQCIDDINKAYEESLRQLVEKRESLIGEVKGRTEGVEKQLDEMQISAQQQIAHLTAITDIMTNRTRIPVEMDALASLKEALRKVDPHYHQPRQSSKQGKYIVFERNVGMDELGLGKIVNSVGKYIELPTKNSMSTMVPAPDGRMAVGGWRRGGIDFFSADGQLQKTVLKQVEIIGVRFLSDGRYVVLERSNNISLYTPEYTKLNVMFKTQSNVEVGYGKIAVDSDDQIYVGYKNADKIQVFISRGGKAIREIQCDAYNLRRIASHNDSLIIAYSNTIQMIDKEGHSKYILTKSSGQLLAAVSQGNSVLIAWVKYDEGLVSIDEYTNELKHIQSLISDYTIETTKRHWYCLQEFRSGEIAFCTPDRLYIFR